MAFQRNLAPNPAPYDFNSDGHPDYLLYNASTRQTALWYLNNNVHIGGASGPTLPAGWNWWVWRILIATAIQITCCSTQRHATQ